MYTLQLSAMILLLFPPFRRVAPWTSLLRVSENICYHFVRFVSLCWFLISTQFARRFYVLSRSDRLRELILAPSRDRQIISPCFGYKPRSIGGREPYLNDPATNCSYDNIVAIASVFLRERTFKFVPKFN